MPIKVGKKKTLKKSKKQASNVPELSEELEGNNETEENGDDYNKYAGRFENKTVDELITDIVNNKLEIKAIRTELKELLLNLKDLEEQLYSKAHEK